ncbi:MAG: hypothetical protein ACI81T_001733 [Bacteroidia bacterium]
MQHCCKCNSIAFMNKQSKECVAIRNSIDSMSAIRESSAVVCERNISQLLRIEIEYLMSDSYFDDIKISGTFKELKQSLESMLSKWPCLSEDIIQLLQLFFENTATDSVRLSFFTLQSGMCRKFHTDVTDYRLLCTYRGVGTDFVSPAAQPKSPKEINESNVQSLTEGDVLLFRGAMSATEEFPPLLHKSPEVTTPKEHRLVLRLDTNTTVWN